MKEDWRSFFKKLAIDGSCLALSLSTNQWLKAGSLVKLFDDDNFSIDPEAEQTDFWSCYCKRQ